MTEGNSLINIGELAKPATVFIEKISEGIGGVCRPWQIKRVARAEAEADKIKALAQIEIDDELQRRSLNRFMAEETLKQSNIENITRMAIEDLREDARPQDMENDWIANFFDKSKLISDREMQSLWAKVLAGEANSPGKYSKRTVSFLSNIDKSDAELFTKLCGFSCLLSDIIIPIYDFSERIYETNAITFDAIRQLEDIGLIQFEQLTTFEKRGFDGNQILLLYFNTPIFINFTNESGPAFNFGQVILSKTGQELAPISGATPVDGFLDYIIGKWRNMGYVLSSPVVPGAPREVVMEFIQKALEHRKMPIS